ncbi:hypothetical protein ANO14919_063380 [Xylariales sp. No.14919]|nr:hypothetical protein ANO14919_063380 [Xylariales sp. No.14919]
MANTTINEALVTLTSTLNLCPARIWSITRGIRGQEANLPSLILPKTYDGSIVRHTGHDRCSFDHCEASNLDFTSVQQRHEPTHCLNESCTTLHLFPQKAVKSALETGQHAVWRLGGEHILPHPQPFMAVSHVWADGTGTGPTPERRGVNKCLYEFFCNLAQRYNCLGVWWDAISIPDDSDKPARARALRRMHEIYEDARFTFVHDCYLRQWCWSDADAACFAIIMSPWFSRGWTALELACSRRVRIMFANNVVKDLDTDIVDQSSGVACSLIRNLRERRVFTLDDLLSVIGSRYTSWPRDRATIAALLTRTDLRDNMSTQETYQEVLKSIGEVSQGHLFHNLPTMAGAFGWCPARVEDIPPSPSPFVLSVAPDGAVTGRWKTLLDHDMFDTDKYRWTGMHPLIAVQLRATLEKAQQNPSAYMLLVEPMDGITRRVLIVEAQSTNRFLGTLYLEKPEYYSFSPIEMITIGGTGQADNIPSVNSNRTGAASGFGSQLLYAAVNEDEGKLQELIDAGEDINFRDHRTWTALHYACWRENVEIVSILLRSGADGSLTDSLGQRAIHLAAERGNEQLVQMLLTGNLRATCNDGHTVLHRAAAGGCVPIVSWILDKCDTSALDSKQRTAMDLARDLGYAAAARMIFKRSGLMSVEGFESMPWLTFPSNPITSLHYVAGTGNLTDTKKLLEQGADVNCRDEENQEPLDYAVGKGDINVVKLLLKHGAHPDGIDERNCQSRLSHAAEYGHKEVVRTLLQYGARADSTDRSGRTPLFYAAIKGHEEIVAILQHEENVRIDSKDEIYGQTPLSWAAEGGHTAVVKLLISSGANPDASDNHGRTALSWAAERAHVDVLRLLIENGANTNSTDNHGRTPLSWAAECGDERAGRVLIENGAVVESRDVFGRTPLMYAALNTADRAAGLVQILS